MDHQDETIVSIRLKSHCKHGHEFNEENTGIARDGRRFCKTCRENSRAGNLYQSAQACVEAACPKCGIVRLLSQGTFKRQKNSPSLCRSCSRRGIRPTMTFPPINCKKCGVLFKGRSGSTRYCDDCSRREAKVPRPCPICGRKFIGYKNRRTCGQSCRRRLVKNESYFGGRLFEAEGWEAKICQICDKHIPKKYHIHHVFGYPNHSRLVVLCPGCHDAVSKLASRRNFGWDKLAKVAWFAMAQRLGEVPGQFLLTVGES